VTRRIPLRLKVLFVSLVACGLASFLAWAVLLTSFCSASRPRMADTQHQVAYGCHGMTVYISQLESAMRDWLIPLGGLFIFFSLLAAVRIAIAAGAVKIKVSLERRS